MYVTHSKFPRTLCPALNFTGPHGELQSLQECVLDTKAILLGEEERSPEWQHDLSQEHVSISMLRLQSSSPETQLHPYSASGPISFSHISPHSLRIHFHECVKFSQLGTLYLSTLLPTHITL